MFFKALSSYQDFIAPMVDAGAETALAQIQQALSSYPVLIVIAVVLVLGIVKKLVKLAALAAVLALGWFALRYLGYM